MTRRKIKVKVYQKINLSLNILGTRGDMHVLDTVTASVDNGDTVTVCERFDDIINVEFSRFPGAVQGNSDGGRGGVSDADQNSEDGGCANFRVSDIVQNNTALKAAEILRGQFGPFGADIYIDKNIPVSAGLGGSSADAAGVIVALDAMFDFSARGLSAQAAALKTGSDVPAMLTGGFLRVGGTGGKIERLNSARELFAVVCKGAAGVNSGRAYAEFDKMYPSKKFAPSNNDALVSALANGDMAGVIRNVGNALAAPAIALCPEINSALAALSSVGADCAFMTGSGSACVGLFPSLAAARAAAASLSARNLYARAQSTLPLGVEILSRNF
ncbi:MAG: hypothetical protein LBP26_03765 [Clostridiales bacterium]|jgi:4-diphosphocytidyl-2-C-methyl-D-erythritol kinase|nr:hypothetical protein [Clostridiales bacterium]